MLFFRIDFFQSLCLAIALWGEKDPAKKRMDRSEDSDLYLPVILRPLNELKRARFGVDKIYKKGTSVSSEFQHKILSLMGDFFNGDPEGFRGCG